MNSPMVVRKHTEQQSNKPAIRGGRRATKVECPEAGNRMSESWSCNWITKCTADDWRAIPIISAYCRDDIAVNINLHCAPSGNIKMIIRYHHSHATVCFLLFRLRQWGMSVGWLYGSGMSVVCYQWSAIRGLLSVVCYQWSAISQGCHSLLSGLYSNQPCDMLG